MNPAHVVTHIAPALVALALAGMPRPAFAQVSNLAAAGDFEAAQLATWHAFGDPKPVVTLTNAPAFAGRQSVRLDFPAPSFGGLQRPNVVVNRSEPVPLLIEAAARRDAAGKEEKKRPGCG
jgi:hypothetical protein